MRTQVWVYFLVAVLSLGAGVAIAGVPTFEDREPTIQTPLDTTTTTTEAPPVESNEVSEPVATDAPTETSATTTSRVSSTASTTGSTTTASTTTSTVPLVERSELDVVVVNAAERAGVASIGSGILEEAGYVDVGSFDGSETFDATAVFAAAGLEGEAERLAQEVGIRPDLIFPIDSVPTVSGLGDEVQLIVYVGRDARVLPFFN